MNTKTGISTGYQYGIIGGNNINIKQIEEFLKKKNESTKPWPNIV